MAFGNGPYIVTNGLVLALDAADRNSYPGSGTTWFDVSGNNNHGTLTNSPAFSTSGSGCISFDGVDDFVTMNSSTSLTTTTPTLIITCTNNSGTILAKGGYGSHWNYGLTGVTSTTFKARNNNADLTSPSFSSSTSAFNIYAMVWNGSAVLFYRNGIYGGSVSTNYSPSAQNSLFLRIGCAWNNNTSQNVEFYSGNIASVQIYNRALSATEIQQNYNATKSRFNL
jgi:hypothetical protein